MSNEVAVCNLKRKKKIKGTRERSRINRQTKKGVAKIKKRTQTTITQKKTTASSAPASAAGIPCQGGCCTQTRLHSWPTGKKERKRERKRERRERKRERDGKGGRGREGKRENERICVEINDKPKKRDK